MAIRQWEGLFNGAGKRIGIVASRFNGRLVERLVEGATDCLLRHGVVAEDLELVRVPGAWEIPLALEELAASRRFDALVALGVVLRGETAHFEFVSGECSRGCSTVSSRHRLAVGFGVLTCAQVSQAEERAGGKLGNKGWDAALAALEMANLQAALKGAAGPAPCARGLGVSKRPQGKRHMAREMALRMLYQIDLGGGDVEQVFAAFDPVDFLSDGAAGRSRQQAEERRLQVEAAFEHARELVEGTRTQQDEIDGLIRKQADNWRLERMSPVDRNILRLAVFEMSNEVDVPKLVIVDEAIELAKRYGSENSGRFVNGLLDGLLKRHEFPGVMK